MRRGRLPENWAAYLVAGIVVCALTTEASASLRGYCTAYGNEAADRKTGIAGSAKSISATAARKWQTAYDKAFSSGMSHYQVEIVKAAAVPAAKVPEADKVPKAEKVPESDGSSATRVGEKAGEKPEKKAREGRFGFRRREARGEEAREEGRETQAGHQGLGRLLHRQVPLL